MTLDKKCKVWYIETVGGKYKKRRIQKKGVKKMGKVKTLVTVAIFEFALGTLAALKARDAKQLAKIDAKIAELNAKKKSLNAEYTATAASLLAETLPQIAQWATQNEGSYVGQSGTIEIVRPYVRRNWDAEEMFKLLQDKPEIFAMLQSAYSETPVAMQVKFKPN